MNKKENILIVLPSLTLGGAEKQALSYACSLMRLGFNPVILGLGREGEMIQELNALKIDYKTYPFSTFFYSKKLKQLYFLIKFIFFVRSLNCKIAISFTYWPNVIFKLIYKFSGVKKMYWNQRSVDDQLSPVFWERISKNINVHYIANSITSASSISNRHSISLEKIKVIYNVMEFSSTNIRKQNKDTIDIIMVANFYEEKDHFTLIRAFKKVVDEHPEQILKLHLVGNAPGISNRFLEVKALAFDLGLCSNVIFHGVVSDVTTMLRQMDIGVLSTYSEGFSNAIMEYMDAELPIIASAIDPNLEALKDVNKPFLFELENSNELAEKLIQLIFNENLRVELGLRNRKIAEKSFNIINLDLALKQLFRD